MQRVCVCVQSRWVSLCVIWRCLELHRRHRRPNSSLCVRTGGGRVRCAHGERTWIGPIFITLLSLYTYCLVLLLSNDTHDCSHRSKTSSWSLRTPNSMTEWVVIPHHLERHMLMPIVRRVICCTCKHTQWWCQRVWASYRLRGNSFIGEFCIISAAWTHVGKSNHGPWQRVIQHLNLTECDVFIELWSHNELTKG